VGLFKRLEEWAENRGRFGKGGDLSISASGDGGYTPMYDSYENEKSKTEKKAETTPVKTTTKPKWNANVFCDSCGQRAYVKTQHETGELTWCKHHAEKFDVFSKHIVLEDSRDELNRPQEYLTQQEEDEINRKHAKQQKKRGKNKD